MGNVTATVCWILKLFVSFKSDLAVFSFHKSLHQAVVATDRGFELEFSSSAWITFAGESGFRS